MIIPVKRLLERINDKNYSLSSLLREVKIIGEDLRANEFIIWIDKELSGYGKDEKVPEYRIVDGELKGLNPYRGWVSIIHKHPETQELISKRGVVQSIGELEELLKQENKSGSFIIKYPADIEASLKKAIDCDTEISLFIGREQIISILKQVRNNVLDWALKLGEQTPKDK